MTYPKVSTGRPPRRLVEPRTSRRSRSGCWRTGRTTTPSAPASSSGTPGENGDNEFVFYDGPPFANGLPHYGHLLTGYVKDLIPRYQTMRGRRVERRFGWDTHGLPAELEAMRQLGLKTTEEILDLGIEKFNDACRASVMQVHLRVARLRHPAGPLGRLRPRLPDPRPRLHGVGDVGLQAALRQGPGLRGLPGAALLLERRDPAVHPRAADGRRRLPEPPGPRGHRRPAAGDGRVALVWTTTPWTLPSNLAIMVGPDIDYVVVESDVDRHHRALRHRRGPAARRTPASSGTSPHDRGAAQGRRPGSAARTRRRSPTTSATRTPSAWSRRRVRHHHRRHRAGAHRRRLR